MAFGNSSAVSLNRSSANADLDVHANEHLQWVSMQGACSSTETVNKMFEKRTQSTDINLVKEIRDGYMRLVMTHFSQPPDMHYRLAGVTMQAKSLPVTGILKDKE